MAVRFGDLGTEVTGSLVPDPHLEYELYSVPTFPTGSPERLFGAEIGSNKRPVQPGDVLLCKINPRINRVWMVAEPANGQPQLASTEYLVLRVGNELLARYVMWYLRSPRFRAWIELAVEGATGSHTRAKSGPILDQTIPIAPEAEQDRIVAVIEAQFSRLHDAVGSLHMVRRRLPQLRRSVLAIAVQQGEEQLVGDILEDIEAGRSFKTGGRPASSEEWGVIKVSAMTWGRFLESENKAVPSSTIVDPRFEIQPGDVLLSRANTSQYVGATVYVDRCRPRLLLSDKSMRLAPTPAVDRRWLAYALNSPALRTQMSAFATGTSDSMRNISQEKVKRLQLRVPTIDEQLASAAEVDRQLSVLDALTMAVDHALTRSDHVGRSILERAFSGRLLPQDPSDEPASELLARVARRRAPTAPKRRRRP
jgi:type I restriction enzyme S subunit